MIESMGLTIKFQFRSKCMGIAISMRNVYSNFYWIFGLFFNEWLQAAIIIVFDSFKILRHIYVASHTECWMEIIMSWATNELYFVMIGPLRAHTITMHDFFFFFFLSFLAMKYSEITVIWLQWVAEHMRAVDRQTGWQVIKSFLSRRPEGCFAKHVMTFIWKSLNSRLNTHYAYILNFGQFETMRRRQK